MNLRRMFLADERGFTMASVMITMMILGVFAVGAWSAAIGDMAPTRADADRKEAYEAADAGIQWYSYQLAKNANYWTYCSDPTKVDTGVNAKGSRTSWRTLPSSKAQFAVELIPVATKTCSQTDPSGTMLDGGILRVRSTGRFNGHQRQIVATFRRSSFLDYIYFTQWETLPPAAYPASTQSWAQDECDEPRAARHNDCYDIQFPSGDSINGPLHSEDDSLLVCGSPTFGRTVEDKIEVAKATSSATAYKQNGGCSGTPNTKGNLKAPTKGLDMPDDNAALKDVADYKFTGSTCIVFNGNQATVYPNQTRWGQPAGGGFANYSNQIPCPGTGTGTTYALDTDTIFWVGSGLGCSGKYDRDQQYDDASTCGHVAVRGTYSTNVTVAAANDIIVHGNLVRSGTTAMLGLVAGKFVRVYHPGTFSSGNCTGNLSGFTPVTQIDAAILATTGSFIADNWDCGAPLGTLSVRGAIAQYWRGTVGTGSGSAAATGYIKNYVYDDRLKYREPPQFLDPIASQWNLLRASEQSPVLTS